MATLWAQDFRLYDAPSSSPDSCSPLFSVEEAPEHTNLRSTRQGSGREASLGVTTHMELNQLGRNQMGGIRDEDKVRRNAMWPALEILVK